MLNHTVLQGSSNFKQSYTNKQTKIGKPGGRRIRLQGDKLKRYVATHAAIMHDQCEI